MAKNTETQPHPPDNRPHFHPSLPPRRPPFFSEKLNNFTQKQNVPSTFLLRRCWLESWVNRLKTFGTMRTSLSSSGEDGDNLTGQRQGWKILALAWQPVFLVKIGSFLSGSTEKRTTPKIVVDLIISGRRNASLAAMLHLFRLSLSHSQ